MARTRIGSTTIVVLVVLLCAVSLARLRTYEEPLDLDITTYAVIGHEMLAGRDLYSDLWDHKPPLIHLAYAAAEVLAGYGLQEVYLLGVLAAAATLLGVFTAARRGGASTSMALWAAAIWAAVSGDMSMQANQPNTEVFLNACLVWALAVLLALDGGREDRRRLVSAGSLFALASLFKPVAVAVAAALALAHVLWPPGGKTTRVRALLQTAGLAIPGAVAWLAAAVWFGLSGRFGAFASAVFAYNGWYAGSPAENLLHALAPPHLAVPAMSAVQPLVIVAALALLAMRVPGHGRTAGFACAYAVGTWAAIVLPGKAFPHYYQLWLPLLALTAVWGLGALQDAASPAGTLIVRGAPAFLVVVLVLAQAPSYIFLGDGGPQRVAGTRPTLPRDQASAINALLAPPETFYLWGAQTGLYFSTRRHPPTGVFYNLPLLAGPLREQLSARVLRDLRVRRPELVLIPRGARLPPHQPVLEWIAAEYSPIPASGARTGALFMTKIGGALESRLYGPPASNPDHAGDAKTH